MPCGNRETGKKVRCDEKLKHLRDDTKKKEQTLKFS